MAGGVRVFGSESWSKRVDIRKSNGEGLNVQLSTNTQESWLSKHILLVINQLISEWDVREVEKVIIIIGLLFLLVLLWLLSLSLILGSLGLIGGLLVILILLELLGGFWCLLLVLELAFGNWIMGRRQHSGHLEHLSGTLTVRGCDDWGVNIQETSLLEE
jgi:hypothetical protein